MADSSEVELIEPFDSGDKSEDDGGHPVVVVVKPTSFGDVFAGFPGFGRFPGFNNFHNSFSGFGNTQHHRVSLEDIFGGEQVTNQKLVLLSRDLISVLSLVRSLLWYLLMKIIVVSCAR